MDVKYKIRFGSDADGLAGKVLTGEKSATSSLYEYYLMNINEAMTVGEYAAVLDSHGNEVCVVRIERVEVRKFKDIDEVFAVEEGDGSLENWLEIHTGYYSSLLEKVGQRLTGDTELLCEWFRVIPQVS